MTDQIEVVRFLSKVPLFSGLAENQLRKLAKSLRERDYQANEVILEQGKLGVGLFVILSGEVKVVREQVDGDVFELDHLRVTDFLGSFPC